MKIIAPTSNLTPEDSKECHFYAEAFFERKIEGDKVQFEPEVFEGNYNYLWTVTYRNGSVKTST